MFWGIYGTYGCACVYIQCFIYIWWCVCFDVVYVWRGVFESIIFFLCVEKYFSWFYVCGVWKMSVFWGGQKRVFFRVFWGGQKNVFFHVFSCFIFLSIYSIFYFYFLFFIFYFLFFIFYFLFFIFYFLFFIFYFLFFIFVWW